MIRLSFFLFVFLLSCRQSDEINIKTDLIQLQIIENNQGGHKDILFKISGLTEQKAFDSYFFSLALKGDEQLVSGVASLFEYWKEKVSMMRNGETVFLPIDFSDQYTGCVKVNKEGKKLKLTYGISKIMGLNVNPLDPKNYHKEVKDFEADNDRFIIVDPEKLINSLNNLITQLKNPL